MLIEVTKAEFELIECSVEKRLQAWCRTLEYLETGETEGLVEECHKESEARWLVSQYRLLTEKLKKSR